MSLPLTSITPVVLCGGSGTRLWPLSRKSFPKQFVPLIGNKSLLQLTLERVFLLSKSVICVASDESDTYADVADLVKQLHYQSATTVEEGIKFFVAWYRNEFKLI